MLTSYNAVSLDSYLYTVLEIYKSKWEHNLDSVVGSVFPSRVKWNAYEHLFCR